MTIFLKNTLSGEKEEFKSIKKGRAGIYHCGPTVYSKQHLGNISAFIYSDTLRRFLNSVGYKTKLVVNITDVGHLVSDADDGEDKMEKASQKTNRTAREIADEVTKQFMIDLQLVNVGVSSISFPKATENIPEQIEIIKTLEKEGFTYKISDGIYFDTSKFSDYGKLGNINIEGLKEGARVESNGEKKNVTDFALWKFSNPLEKRQQEWQSPWGVGFPGWHIECSAMSRKLLGQPFDIHIGGIEHIPIHHNNEIAQSVGAFKKPLANYWIHFNHLMLNGSKLSKSDGNVMYVDELISKNISPAIFRYWLLTTNYGAQKNLTMEALEASKSAVEKILRLIKNTKTKFFESADKNTVEKFSAALSDNLNSASAIAVLWEMMRDEKISASKKKKTVLMLDRVLGVGFEKLARELKDSVIPAEVIEIAHKRELARKNRDFTTSDKLREEAKTLGFDILDGQNGFEIKTRK